MLSNKKLLGITCIYVLLMIALLNSVFSAVSYDGGTVISISGNENLANVCAALGNSSPEWKCWGKTHTTQYNLRINASSTLTIQQGENLYVGYAVDIFGTLKIDRGFLYINSSEYFSDTVGGSGVLNITGTQKQDRIPSPSENYDAGILIYPEDIGTFINFYVYGGFELYIRDAKAGTFAYEFDEAGKKDIQRSYLKFLTGAVVYDFILKDNDILKNDYIESGNKVSGTWFYIYLVSATTNNIYDVFINLTNSGSAGVYAEEGSQTNFYNGGMDDCFIMSHITAGTPTSLNFINSSFVNNRTLETCRIITFPGSAFDTRNNITINYPINLYTKDHSNTLIPSVSFNVFRSHYRNNWSSLAERWELIYSGATDSNGLYNGIEIPALNFVFTNQTERYIYQINFTKSTYIDTGIVLNWSNYNRGVKINITLLEPIRNIYQTVTTNATTGIINISRLQSANFINAYFISYNHSSGNIDFYVDDHLVLTRKAFNNTPMNFNTNFIGAGTHTLQFRFSTAFTPIYTIMSWEKIIKDSSNLYTGLSILLFLNIGGLFMTFWFINNLRVNISNYIDKLKNGLKASEALKTDVILKIVAINIIAILNLLVSGFTYYTAQEINSSLANLSFVFVIINIIFFMLISILMIIKIFYFPFEVLYASVEKFQESNDSR